MHRAEVPKEHKSRGSEGGRGAEIVCWCFVFICLFFLLFIVGVLGGLSGVFVRGLGWRFRRQSCHERFARI